MAAVNLIVFALYCTALCHGQEIGFQQLDFPADGNMTSLVVNKRGSNVSPLMVTIRPLTISQYQMTGNSGCNVGSSIPAETDDFDGAQQTAEFVPTMSDDLESIAFQVRIFEDNVVEGEEIFVVLLEVSGGSVTIRISCTIVRIQETFSGQFLRWTHNGEVVMSTLSLEFPERNSSEVIITAERLVPSELTTTITSSLQTGTLTENTDFTLDGSFTILPNMSSVNISIFIIDDGITESDESASIIFTASVPELFLSSSIQSRTVNVKILDDEVLDYTFVNTSSVINVTEGESIIVMTGLDPVVPTGTRADSARIVTEDGSAMEGTDFRRVDQQVSISTSVQSQTITTMFRPGIQQVASFTVRLLPDGMTANQTNVRGMVTVFILDDTRIPLTPVIDTIRFTGQNNDQITVTWTQVYSLPNIPDSFQVIIKSCSIQTCVIDPDMRLPDEMTFSVNKDMFQLSQSVDRFNSTFGVVVCAINSRGRNCTASYTLAGDNVIPVATITTDRTFIIWVVILCVVLFLLCCLIPIVLLVICCCCGRDQMRTYYPRKAMKRQLKGKSPDGSTNIIMTYEEEQQTTTLKYV